jgi:aspartyl-tRNA(Asn)/glutamyl-tRNA(Gln) amidotransferase subunit B
MNTYTPVIGLEVHIELSTNSKMFCACSAHHFGVKPNTNTCPVCLGLPGALPFANWSAIESVIRFGLAYNCEIAGFSKFDRKNYFYPDLPKSFQISQYDLPFCKNGEWVSRNGKTIKIKRVHLEEDTAKLQHASVDGHEVSLIDFNRSGVPLMELVTEPDFDEPQLVDEFLRDVQQVVRYLSISNADMEKGSMRLEANISLTSDGSLPDYKIELKNINSFKFLQKAVAAEILRQSELLEKGENIKQETQGYNEDTGKTFAQRSKEEAHDYRYFPEPDLAPIQLDEVNVTSLKEQLPELPWEKRARFTQFSLPLHYIEVLTESIEKADYFDRAVELAKVHEVSIKELAGLMVNQNMDKELSAEALVKKLVELSKRDFASSDEVEKAIAEVIAEQEKAVNDYKDGKGAVIGFLMGMVQKKLQGNGDTKVIHAKLVEKLQE